MNLTNLFMSLTNLFMNLINRKMNTINVFHELNKPRDEYT
jgi:hypothetical protein